METEVINNGMVSDELPIGKIEQLDQKAPTLEELIPSNYPINSEAVADLYDRSERPASEGDVHRKNLTFTITPQTDDEWRDFLQTHTGTLPQRGKGISSPMVELSMQVLMAIVAEFKLGEVAASLTEISSSNESRQRLKANLAKLAEQL